MIYFLKKELLNKE